MPDGDDSSGFDTAKLIAGGFAVISGAVTVIGGFTGAVPRLIRNDSAAFGWAIALSLIAVGLSLVGSQVGNRHARPIPATPASGENDAQVKTRLDNDDKALTQWKESLNIVDKPRVFEWFHSINTRGFFVAVGFLAFIASAAVMIMGLQSTLVKIDQPQISTTWKDITAGVSPIAQVEVSIDGVATDDTLIVTVHPGEKLTSDNVKGVVTNYSIYKAKVGANLDGSAKMNFEVQVPQGFGSLQIVASLNDAMDCAGNLDTGSRPVDSASGSAAASGPGVTASTSVLQPVQPDEENYSCVVVLAPADGVVPPPSDALTPMATATVTVPVQ
jgi:hypothetical protein